MKQIILLASLISSAAFASSAQLDLIKNNLEVKSAIAAFEANRGETCNALSAANLMVSKNGAAKITVSCNRYDKNGDPQADVYILTIKGALYPNSFELSSISIVGAE